MDRLSSRRPERPDCSEAEAIALSALAWTLAEPGRADRLLALTGLDPDGLRARIGDRTLLAAVIQFLGAHEADLVACAEAVGSTPERLIVVGEVLA